MNKKCKHCVLFKQDFEDTEKGYGVCKLTKEHVNPNDLMCCVGKPKDYTSKCKD